MQLYKSYIIDRSISLPLLEKALISHLNGDLTEQFHMSIVFKAMAIKEEVSNETMLISNVPRVPKITREIENAARLALLPEIQVLVPIHRTTTPNQHTESETEYTVQCVKHIFIVFKFDCLNTLSDQILENARVELTIAKGFTTRAVIPCPKLPYNDLKTIFAIVEFPPYVGSSAGMYIMTDSDVAELVTSAIGSKNYYSKKLTIKT